MKLFVVACLSLILGGISLAIETEDTVLAPQAETEEDTVLAPQAETEEDTVLAPQAETEEDTVLAPQAETEEDTVPATEAPGKDDGDLIGLPAGDDGGTDDKDTMEEDEDTEGILSRRCKIRCICPRGSGECSCCKLFRVAGDRHKACFVVSYRARRLRVNARVNYNTIRTASTIIRGSARGRRLVACGTFLKKCPRLRRRVCARLRVTRATPGRVYFKASFSVRGAFDCDISTK